MDNFIGEFVDRLIATSLHTAVLGLVVWALSHRVFRLSPHTQCWLWWLVSFQALVGLIAGPIDLAWLPAVPAEATTIGVRSPGAIVESSPAIPAWKLVAFSVWSLLVTVTASVTLREWQKGRAFVRRALPYVGDAVLTQLKMLARRKGVRQLPRVLVSEECTSPLLAGSFRPILVMPASSALSGVDLEMAISHELAHLRRNDLVWGVIPCLTRQLFFFHPVVRIAVSEYDIAREAACDAEVLDTKHLSPRDYGKLLVRLGTSGEPVPGVGVRSATFHTLKRRLTLLQLSGFLSPSASLALLMVMAVGVLPLRLVAAQSTSDAQQVLAELATNNRASSVGESSEGRGSESAPASRLPAIEAPVGMVGAQVRTRSQETARRRQASSAIRRIEQRRGGEGSRESPSSGTRVSGSTSAVAAVEALLKDPSLGAARLDRESITRLKQLADSPERQARIAQWRKHAANANRSPPLGVEYLGEMPDVSAPPGQ